MANLPDDPQMLINALGLMCKKRKQTACLRLLEEGTAHYELWHQDYGVNYYRVFIKLPFELFIDSQAERTSSQEILNKFAKEIIDSDANPAIEDIVFSVDITPVDDWRSSEAPLQASNETIVRMWREGHFRLFLSHSSKDKVFASNLKKVLSLRRIDAFVAHEDIEPTLEWQQEIKFGLASCHAILYLASKAANESAWCQQEVGWGLGRGIVVHSYALSADPAGFIGATQALKIINHDHITIRDKLIAAFVSNDKTERAMHEPLVLSLISAKTAKQAMLTLDSLEIAQGISRELLERIDTMRQQHKIVLSNDALSKRITDLLVKKGYKSAPVQPMTSEDEYDPFADE